MNGKGVLLVIVAVLSLYQMVLGEQLDHPIQKRNLGLSVEQLACIRTEFFQANSDASCATVQAGLEMLYNVDDVAEAIGTRIDLVEIFCQQSCGQALINAWGECSIYDDIQSVAELLINMCSANNGRRCYQDYTQLLAVFEDGATCTGDLDSGSCSTDCRTSITLDVQNYGCCINVPIMYEDAIETAEDINAEADTLFSECRVTRPSVCPAPARALGPPGTVIPGSQPSSPAGSQPSSPPGSGAGQPVAAAAFVLLNSLVAFIMHF